MLARMALLGARRAGPGAAVLDAEARAGAASGGSAVGGVAARRRAGPRRLGEHGPRGRRRRPRATARSPGPGGSSPGSGRATRSRCSWPRTGSGRWSTRRASTWPRSTQALAVGAARAGLERPAGGRRPRRSASSSGPATRRATSSSSPTASASPGGPASRRAGPSSATSATGCPSRRGSGPLDFGRDDGRGRRRAPTARSSALELSRAAVTPGLPMTVTADGRQRRPRPADAADRAARRRPARAGHGPGGRADPGGRAGLGDVPRDARRPRRPPAHRPARRGRRPAAGRRRGGRPVEVAPALPVLLVDGEPGREPLGGETDFLRIALAPTGDDTPQVKATVVDAEASRPNRSRVSA